MRPHSSSVVWRLETGFRIEVGREFFLRALRVSSEVPGADVDLGPFTLLSKKPAEEKQQQPRAASKSSLLSSLQNFDRVLELPCTTTDMLCYVEDTSSTSFTRARISYCSVPSLVMRSCAHIPQLFVSGRSVCISRKVCLFFRRNYKIFFELRTVSEIRTIFLIFCSSKVGKICSIRVPNLFCGIVNQAAVRKLVNFWFDRDLIQLIS